MDRRTFLGAASAALLADALHPAAALAAPPRRAQADGPGPDHQPLRRARGHLPPRP